MYAAEARVAGGVAALCDEKRRRAAAGCAAEFQLSDACPRRKHSSDQLAQRRKSKVKCVSDLTKQNWLDTVACDLQQP